MLRTDLAMEVNMRHRGKLAGVSEQSREENGIRMTMVHVQTREAANALGKPPGRYFTMELGNCSGRQRLLGAGYLSEALQDFLPENGSILVVGLGNRAVTPDSLGARTVDGLLITRHLTDEFPFLRSIAALCPGVLGQTGMESFDIIKAVVDSIHPAGVIAVDALAAREPSHIGTLVQLSDTGIQPGSGVGNRRGRLDEKTLGCPVLALGVPTVTDAECTGQIVTSAEIDAQVAGMSRMLALALNRAFQPALSQEELDAFIM